MTDRQLPADATPARTTPSFTSETVPKALCNAHHATVWAELVVEHGAVLFIEEDPPWRTRITAGSRQVIVPIRTHHVDPEIDSVFHVQFYD